jgi:hypothetical protein
MMKRIILILVLLGCGACEKRTVPLNIEEKIVNVNRAFKEGDVKKEAGMLIAAINAVSNKTERIAYCKRWMDELMSLDVSDMNYKRQGDALDNMYDLVEKNISQIIRRSDAPLILIWELRIQLLEWVRKELERLKPSGPLPKGIAWTGHSLNVLDFKVDKEFSDWQWIFKRNASRYEMRIRMLEGRWFIFETQQSSETEKETIRDLVRKFIRRPIRNEKELLRDFKERRAMEFPYDDIPRNMGPAEFRMPR